MLMLIRQFQTGWKTIDMPRQHKVRESFSEEV